MILGPGQPQTAKNYCYRPGNIQANVVSDLFKARNARNELLHKGKYPQKDHAKAALSAAEGLLSEAVGKRDIPLLSINLDDHSLTDPFQRHSGPVQNVQYWMPFPKLPGEEEIDK